MKAARVAALREWLAEIATKASTSAERAKAKADELGATDPVARGAFISTWLAAELVEVDVQIRAVVDYTKPRARRAGARR